MDPRLHDEWAFEMQKTQKRTVNEIDFIIFQFKSRGSEK